MRPCKTRSGRQLRWCPRTRRSAPSSCTAARRSSPREQISPRCRRWATSTWCTARVVFAAPFRLSPKSPNPPSRRSPGTPSEVAWSWLCVATSGSPVTTRKSANPKSPSASFPAQAEPSVCLASSDPPAPRILSSAVDSWGRTKHSRSVLSTGCVLRMTFTPKR